MHEWKEIDSPDNSVTVLNTATANHFI